MTLTKEPTTLTHDPTDDDFPHGTRAGYNRGCNTATADCPGRPTCHEQRMRERKALRLRRAGVLRPSAQDMVPSGPVLAHVERLLAIPGATTELVAHLADLPPSTLSTVRTRGLPKVRIGTRDKLMSVTAAAVRAAIPDVPSAKKVVQVIRSMQVQGFTIKWQAEQIGYAATSLTHIAAGDHGALPDTAVRLLRLANRVEMETGPSRITATKARKAGWHPLACYDRNGDLIPGSVRTKETDLRDAARELRARQIIEILWESLTGRNLIKTAEECGTNDKDVSRIRTALGLHFEDTLRGYSAPRKSCRAQADRILRLVREQRNAKTRDDIDFVTDVLGLSVNATPAFKEEVARRERKAAA